jgi:hypothetical protein
MDGSPRLRSSAILFAFLTGLIALVLNPAIAVASCVPSRTSDGAYHHIGRGQPGTAVVDGVSSTIRTYRPYVHCGDISYSWVMLTRNQNYRWAQIGPYEACDGHNMTIQWEYQDGANPHQLDFNELADNQDHYYDVIYAHGTFMSQYQFYRDGTNYANVDMTWVPTSAEWHGEVSNRRTQMMGDVGNHQHFLQNIIKINGTWHNSTAGLDNDPLFKISGTAFNFDIWDTCT